MEQKLTIQQKSEIKQYTEALRKRVQSRRIQLTAASQEKEKVELAKLQDEITALAELYRHCYTEVIDGNKTDVNRLQEIQQIEKLFTTAKEQMLNGQIDSKHLLKVASLARKNLQLICQSGNLGTYAELLLAESKEKDER